MNLKEAFRFQNKIERLISETEDILSSEDCIIQIVSSNIDNFTYDLQGFYKNLVYSLYSDFA